MPFPALLIPLIFWAGVAALSSWAVSRALPLSASHSIEINAPAEDVWDMITDLGRAPEWNEHIILSSAPAGLVAGGKLRMRTRHPETRHLRASFRSTIITLIPNREMTWEAKILARWILTARDTIALTPLGENRTKVTQTMSFKGTLSPGVPFLTSIGKIQEASNLKLKELVEKA